MKKLLLVIALVLVSAGVFAGNVYVSHVNYTPAPAQPGKYLELWVWIDNNSNFGAEDVKVWLDLKYPFSLDPGKNNERLLGNIKNFESATVKYDLRVDPMALDGSYDLEVYANEKDALGGKKQKFTITIQQISPVLEIVDSSAAKLRPGEDVEAVLTIRNLGKAPANNIRVVFEEDRTVTTTGGVVEREIMPIGAAATFIEEIKAGEEARIKVMLSVNPDAELKNYMLPVEIRYYDPSGSSMSNTSYLGIRVDGGPIIDGVVSDVDPAAYPGAITEVTFDLFNIGVGSAYYAVAKIESEGLGLEEKKNFIGTLEADDFDSFKETINVPAGITPGKYPINLTLEYLDSASRNKKETITVYLDVLSVDEAMAASGQGGSILGSIVFLAILAVVGWFAYKKVVKPRLQKR